MSASNYGFAGGVRCLFKVVLVAAAAWLGGSTAEAGTVSVSNLRGTVTSDGTALGALAFAAAGQPEPGMEFRGAVWSGEIEVVGSFPDEVLPGRLAAAVTVTNGAASGGDVPVLNLPIELPILIPSLPYILRPLGAGGVGGFRINEPPAFLQIGADNEYLFQFAPTNDGLSVRYSGSTAIALPGGGTAEITLSGALSRADLAATNGSTSVSVVVRLTDADPGRFFAGNGLSVSRETGTWQLGTPSAPLP